MHRLLYCSKGLEVNITTTIIILEARANQIIYYHLFTPGRQLSYTITDTTAATGNTVAAATADACAKIN